MNWRNLLLSLQTLGVFGLAARAWPIIDEFQKEEEREKRTNPLKFFPPVSIIVPARNEEINIERCLQSLVSQDYPDYEIIVVNDGSSDATPLILEKFAKNNPGFKVVNLDGILPDGWAGKPHAMFEGVKAARPESSWLLFTDADTCHHPPALKTALGQAIQEKADLFSILPEIEMHSFWEKLLMPVAVLGISLQYPLKSVNSPSSPLAVANGQFLLIWREKYDAVGGFGGKLRNSLLDDRDMALAVKKSGGRLVLRDGRSLVSVRMYRSLSEIWSGWRKNAFVGSRSAYFTVPFFIVICIGLGVLPFIQLPLALLKCLSTRSRRGRVLLLASFIQAGTTIFSRYRLDKGFGVPFLYSVLSPLGLLVFAGILSDSMWRSLTGQGLSWKGRMYDKAAKSQQLI